MAGCGSVSVRTKADLSKLVYQQDQRTGVWYAVIGHAEGTNFVAQMGGGMSQGFTITYVPCTDQVMAAVREDASHL